MVEFINHNSAVLILGFFAGLIFLLGWNFRRSNKSLAVIALTLSVLVIGYAQTRVEGPGIGKDTAAGKQEEMSRDWRPRSAPAANPAPAAPAAKAEAPEKPGLEAPEAAPELKERLKAAFDFLIDASDVETEFAFDLAVKSGQPVVVEMFSNT